MTTKDLQEGVRIYIRSKHRLCAAGCPLYNRHDSEKDRGRTTLCRFFGI